MVDPEEYIKILFLNDKGWWRNDSHLIITRLKDRFSENFEALPVRYDKSNRDSILQRAASCSVLIKLYWMLCVTADRASTERLDDANRLLGSVTDSLHALADQISTDLYSLSEAESQVLKDLFQDLQSAAPERPVTRPAYVEYPPILGSLAQLGRTRGRFRKASTLGNVEDLKESSERAIMDFFLETRELAQAI